MKITNHIVNELKYPDNDISIFALFGAVKGQKQEAAHKLTD